MPVAADEAREGVGIDSGAAAVPIVRFRAGPHHLAVAASRVRDVEPADDAHAHVGELLGTEVGERSDWWSLRFEDGSRDGVCVAVDGPIVFHDLSMRRIPPMGRALPLHRMRPVVGFAVDVHGQLITLLDGAELAARALEDGA